MKPFTSAWVLTMGAVLLTGAPVEKAQFSVKKEPDEGWAA